MERTTASSASPEYSLSSSSAAATAAASVPPSSSSLSSVSLFPTSPPSSKRVRVTECSHVSSLELNLLSLQSPRQCEVTGSTLSVYICINCGKKFKGKGPNTPLQSHWIKTGHSVYCPYSRDLYTGTVLPFCLTDGIPLQSEEMARIPANIRPQPQEENSFQVRFRVINGPQELTIMSHFINLIAPLASFCCCSKEIDVSHSSSFCVEFVEYLRVLNVCSPLHSNFYPAEFFQFFNEKLKNSPPIPSDPYSQTMALIHLLKGIPDISYVLSSNLKGKILLKGKSIDFYSLSLDINKEKTPDELEETKDELRVPTKVQQKEESLQRLIDDKFWSPTGKEKEYRIQQAPLYLLIHIQRKHFNSFFTEFDSKILKIPKEGISVTEAIPCSGNIINLSNNEFQYRSLTYKLIGNCSYVINGSNEHNQTSTYLDNMQQENKPLSTSPPSSLNSSYLYHGLYEDKWIELNSKGLLNEEHAETVKSLAHHQCTHMAIFKLQQTGPWIKLQ